MAGDGALAGDAAAGVAGDGATAAGDGTPAAGDAAASDGPPLQIDAGVDAAGAPALSSFKVHSTGETTAAGTIHTTGGDGVIYWIRSTVTTKPTPQQIESRQLHDGSPAPNYWQIPVTAPGGQAWMASHLPADTKMYFHAVHRSAAGHYSNILTSNPLSNPGGTGPDGGTGADGATGGGGDGGDGGGTQYTCGTLTVTRKWTPPPLQSPRHVTLTNAKSSVKLGVNEDAIVTCKGTISEGITIHDGRNIVVRECKIVHTCKGSTKSNGGYRGVYVRGFNGSFVSFENLHVDTSACVADALVVNSQLGKQKGGPPFDVYVFNSVLYAGDGHPKGFHADIFQHQGADKYHRDIYVEHVMGGSWYSGFTSYNADNMYVRNSSVTNNSFFGKTCKKQPCGGGQTSLCRTTHTINPSYMAYKLHAGPNVYAYGCAPCQAPKRKLVSGKVIQEKQPKNFTCLPPSVR